MSFLLKKCPNIQVVVEVSFLRRFSRTFEKLQGFYEGLEDQKEAAKIIKRRNVFSKVSMMRKKR